MGQLATFITALTALENTIDATNLTVYQWRPVTIQPPCVYNWILASPSDIPATQTVVDTMNFAVRVVVATSDIDEEEASAAAYFDLVRQVLDRDLIEPHKSTLNQAAHYARRTTTRTLTDTFNEIPYLAMEFTVEAQFRNTFPVL